MTTLLLALAFTSTDELKSQVDAAVKPLIELGCGFVVGVRTPKGNQVWGYGKVTLPGGEKKPSGDTIFEIGSITKAFTGVLLAEAVRRGEVKLDVPARDALPQDLPLPPAITLLHLATHRSGLPPQPPFIGIAARSAANPYADYDRERLHGLLIALEPDLPGKKHDYSNLGAGLAGIALVHAAKAKSFDALVRNRIAEPLQMLDTAEALTGAQKARWARGHNEQGKLTEPWDFATLEACGGLRSTVNDLLQFCDANLGHGPAEIVTAMKASHEPRAEIKGPKVQNGLFWVVMKQGRNGAHPFSLRDWQD